MADKAKFKSDAFESIHDSAKALHRIGALSKVTMREFDDDCLDAVAQIRPAEIRRLRKSHNLSQPVFARYLNTSRSTVEKWETGAKRPCGLALKLLAVVRKHGLQVLN